MCIFHFFVINVWMSFAFREFLFTRTCSRKNRDNFLAKENGLVRTNVPACGERFLAILMTFSAYLLYF